MPGKANGLFDAIASFPALHATALRAATGKRGKPGVAAFLANLETEVLRLERALRTGRYRPGRYKTIEVFDPKHRVVSAAPFRDRVVHHALCAVIEPLFERGFIHDTYANRKGKGHAPGRRPLRALPLRQPQQEHHRQPEQQSRVPCCSHAPPPEPASSRGRRACP